MKMSLLAWLIRLAGLLFATALAAHATIIQLTWTGRGNGNNWSTTANWQGNTAPSNDGLTALTFSSSFKNFASVDTNWNIYSLTFSSASQHGLLAPDDTTRTLTLQNGIEFTSSDSNARLQLGGGRNAGTLNLVLAANQTWNLAQGYTEVANTLSGSGQLTKNGNGSLRLNSGNTYTGGTVLNAGTLELGHSSALGTGTLTLAADSGSNSSARPTLRLLDEITLANNLTLNGNLRIDGEDNVTLSGAITLNQSTVFTLDDTFVTVSGVISGSGSQLTLNGEGGLYLKGANTYTGGTVATKGVLIFDNATAIPATGTLRADADGYIGYGSSSNFQTSFLDKFDKAGTTGAIGVDSEPTAISPITISTAIDLTGFGATTRLASATKGAITGVITPQGSAYRFGGGGGFLQVSSALTGANALTLVSPTPTPLTLRLTNTGNTYTGATTVTQSALRLAAGALPTNSTNWTLGTGGYIGTEGINSNGTELTATQTASINVFLNKFSPANTTGIIGFDNIPGDSTTRVISGDINLGVFTGATPGLYLGTSSDARLTGALTLPAAQTAYRFAAYKGGTLEVASALTGARSVIIGAPDVQATIGDRSTNKYSSVTLSGNNTYTGGTTLYPGTLKLGGTANSTTSVLGTGTLTIAPTSLDFGDEGPTPELRAAASNLTLTNAIALNTSLRVAGSNALVLSGAISGTGGLELETDEDNGSDITLTLSGNNTYTGGTRLRVGDSWTTTLNVNANNALGSGKLTFEANSETGKADVYFNSATPTVFGLVSHNDNSDICLHLATNTQLTVNQTDTSWFNGLLYGNHTTTLTKSGTGTLSLRGDSASSYSGGITVSGGTLIAENSGAFGSGTVTLNGGTLAVNNNTSVSNTLTLTAGKLAGHGSFTSTSPIPSIGTGLTLSPGLAGQGNIGKLNFYELSLAAGGTYEWNLQTSGNASSAVSDQIDVSLPSTLSLNGIDLIANPTASASTRFTLKAISLQSDGTPGTATGFTSFQSYSWTIFSFNSIAGFDANKFIIDASQFSTNFGSGLGAGTFSITQDGNTLKLNFTSVPEPSTYALLALGLGFLALTLRRQARRRA